MLSQSTPKKASLPSKSSPSRLKYFIKNAIYSLFIVLCLFAAIWIYTNGQTWIDFWRYRFYTPEPRVVAVAEKLGLKDQGLYLFYASNPQILEAQLFNNYCGDLGAEKTIVLGCYKTQTIYLFDINEPRLYGIKEVTAAHEMLHAVYERMPLAEKIAVNRLIQNQMISIKDQRIKDLAQRYSRENASMVWNELHSILGTEYGLLSSELEAHYSKYFYDRTKVVGLSQGYEGVFESSRDKIEQYDVELKTLKDKIDTNYHTLGKLLQEINQMSDQLNSLRSTDPRAYNELVPTYNSKANAYNNLVYANRDLIGSYNSLVEVRNKEAIAQADLYRSLDSNYEPVQ